MVMVWWWLGCGPRFTLDEPTCDVDYLEWAGGLTHDVLQGNGRGTFDYRPTDSDIVVQLQGSYDLSTGALEWTRTFADGYYRQVERAEGTGTLWPDGDLDLGYAWSVSLADGVHTLDVRDVRIGCEVGRRVEDADGRVEVYEGTLANGGLTYTREFVEGSKVLQATGQRRPDGTWTESLDFQDADLTYTIEESGNLRDWTWSRSLRYVTTDVDIDGSYQRRPNGRLAVSYEAVIDGALPETWDYRIDPDGGGRGTLTFGASEPCTVTFDDGECELSECGVTGPCVPPLRTEEVLLRL